MAIPGREVIGVGLPNESANSDSLYTAFNKVNNNFATLYACSSGYTNFVANAGISTNANANTGTVTITNTGVLSIIAGTNIVVNRSNGNVMISSTGGGSGGSGTVTSVGLTPVSTSRLTVTNSPVVSSGVMNIDLVPTGVTQGSYTHASITVDGYGRILSAANGTVTGTVTSVGLSAGPGIQVTNSPITTSGTMTITNTGVTRLSAGSGISLTNSTGDITISLSGSTGTVTSVGVTSSTLNVTGSPIATSGTITVELPSTISLSGNITSGNLISNNQVKGKYLVADGSEDLADAGAANLELGATYFTTGATGETGTLAAGVEGQIKTFMMYGDGGGDMVITVTNPGWGGSGTMTFDNAGEGCTLQYINSKWFCVGNNGVTFA